MQRPRIIANMALSQLLPFLQVWYVTKFCRGDLLQLCLQHFVHSHEVNMTGYVVQDLDNDKDTDIDIGNVVYPSLHLTRRACYRSHNVLNNPTETWLTCSHMCAEAVA